MANPTNYFIDASGGSNSNDGSLGSPWQTIAHAIDAPGSGGIAQNTTNGDFINLKDNAPHNLGGTSMNLATNYGTSVLGAPFGIRGYSSAAGDGGIATIDCGGVSLFASGSYQAIMLADLAIQNSNTSNIVVLGTYSTISRCQVSNTTGKGITVGANATVSGCEVYDVGGIAIDMNGNGSRAWGNLVRNGPTNNCTVGIQCSFETTGAVAFNRFQLGNSGGGSVGIYAHSGTFIANNSIWANAGTGRGIDNSGAAKDCVVVLNNVVDGFSGTGGVGIEFANSFAMMHGNYVSNCATKYNVTDQWITRTEARAANTDGGTTAPFTNPSAGDFTPLASVTDLLNSWPPKVPGSGLTNYMWKGAVQPQVSAGGGGISVLISNNPLVRS